MFLIYAIAAIAWLILGARVFLVRDIEAPRGVLKALWMLIAWPYYAWRAGWAPL